MSAFPEPVAVWQGADDPDAPVVVLLHGRGSNEADIIGLVDHLPAGPATEQIRLTSTVPQEIVDKILWEHEILGHDRFLAQIGLGGLPFADTARSIEPLATEVFPVIRRETSTASKEVA